MKKVVFVCLCFAVMASAWIAGCKKDTIDPRTWQPVTFTVPQGWPAPAYNFENNTLNYNGFVLGRKLFYDVRLSRDSTVSCGTCHQQFASFAQLGHDLSHGVDNKLGTRNSPMLANMAWNTSFFWDGGVNHLEAQPINPIQNPVEMDLKMADAVARVRAAAEYKEYFANAFGDETVTSQRIFRAMAQFMGAMVSSNSRYDKYVRQENGGTLTANELNGLAVFRQHCATCHKEPLFSDFSFRNNGLVPHAVNDSGRAHITRDPADLYKFKTPSLRNIAVTSPYMHDGRLKTLEAVLDHYTGGVTAMPTTDPLATNIKLTDTEKKDIISFLKTLTDSTFMNNSLFAEPR
jgi:cytochrome c peroxidase